MGLSRNRWHFRLLNILNVCCNIDCTKLAVVVVLVAAAAVVVVGRPCSGKSGRGVSSILVPTVLSLNFPSHIYLFKRVRWKGCSLVGERMLYPRKKRQPHHKPKSRGKCTQMQPKSREADIIASHKTTCSVFLRTSSGDISC